MGNLKMPDTNKVLFAGRLGQDPDLRYSTNDTAYCKFSVANTRYYRDGRNQKQQETTWMPAIMFGTMAEAASDQLERGSAVLLEGRIQSNDFQDRETGANRRSYQLLVSEFRALEWRDDGQGQQATAKQRPPQATGERTPEYAGAHAQASSKRPMTDDDVPPEQYPEDDAPF